MDKPSNCSRRGCFFSILCYWLARRSGSVIRGVRTPGHTQVAPVYLYIISLFRDVEVQKHDRDSPVFLLHLVREKKFPPRFTDFVFERPFSVKPLAVLAISICCSSFPQVYLPCEEVRPLTEKLTILQDRLQRQVWGSKKGRQRQKLTSQDFAEGKTFFSDVLLFFFFFFSRRGF